MKLTRKLLAAVLAIVMVMCILPLTVSAAENVYVLDAKEHLTAMPEKTKADGDTEVVGQDGYFTIHYSEKTKIDESEKTWDDGYASNQRLNFNGKAQVKPNGTTKNVVEFTTEGPATVKVWWVQAGDDNRQMGIFDAEGELVTQTNDTVEKNAPCLSSLEIPAAGKYFIGGVTNKNYIFKLEVTVTVEDAPVQVAPVAIEDGKYILSWGDLTFGTLPADKGYGYPTAGSLAAYTDADIVTVTNTADGKFTITDSLGRLVYMKGDYNSFNVGETTEGHEWVLEDAGDGLYWLKNVEKGKYVSYSEKYTSWGCYADKYDSGKLTLTAVKAGNEGGNEGETVDLISAPVEYTAAWNFEEVKILTTVWGGTVDPSIIAEGGKLVVTYTGTENGIALALNGNNSWYQFDAPVSNAAEGEGWVATYTYEDLVAKYGTADFSTLGAIQIAASNLPVTVTSVTWVVPADNGGDSDGTGDMIGVVIALLAVSGMGITILKKRS